MNNTINLSCYVEVVPCIMSNKFLTSMLNILLQLEDETWYTIFTLAFRMC